MGAMLNALVRALTTGNAREREAVLAFKDDAAMRAFSTARRSSASSFSGNSMPCGRYACASIH